MPMISTSVFAIPKKFLILFSSFIMLGSNPRPSIFEENGQRKPYPGSLHYCIFKKVSAEPDDGKKGHIKKSYPEPVE
jgi:hypothetical protein